MTIYSDYPKELAYTKAFFGGQFGIALAPRGKDDPHVCFYILTEDDGTWFVKNEGGASSFWIPDLISIIKEAETWMANNCIKDGGWGYNFK